MIKISLEVTPQQLLQIAELLNNSPESISEPSEQKLSKEDPLPTKEVKEAPKATKSPGKIVAMPSFGRTQEQIEAYINSEEARLSEAEAEAAEKKTRKAEKEAAEAIKQKEADDIKKSVNEPIVINTTPLKKPWEL
jgi:hypothetical protein